MIGLARLELATRPLKVEFELLLVSKFINARPVLTNGVLSVTPPEGHMSPGQESNLNYRLRMQSVIAVRVSSKMLGTVLSVGSNHNVPYGRVFTSISVMLLYVP